MQNPFSAYVAQLLGFPGQQDAELGLMSSDPAGLFRPYLFYLDIYTTFFSPTGTQRGLQLLKGKLPVAVSFQGQSQDLNLALPYPAPAS